MKIHACEQCGYEVKYQGELDGKVKHLPDGRHQWTLLASLGARWFGGKGA